jgi:indolepyruvate ferredoxin oxidoreductase alpha subunit
MIKGMGDQKFIIHGRLDGSLPKDGELNPDLIAGALGFGSNTFYNVPQIIETRPPVLCNGCAHVDLYYALNEAMSIFGKGKVFSDIGCYTLGALPPFEAIFSCVDMGASITMAKGAADAGLFPSACVIGDSTFTHSGMTGLLDAVNQNSAVTVIISDNSTTGMTGGQKSSATGKLENICIGLGIEPDHLRLINPMKKNMDENVKILREELEYKGVSVILSQRECIQTAARKHRN